METVFLDVCKEYDVDKIEDILNKQLDGLGVLKKVWPGMTIALKLNLVAAMKPDTAVTTHPAVVEALCRILVGLGAKVIMGDSPGGPYTSAYLKLFYSTCGLNDIASRTGAFVNTDFEQTNVAFEEGVIAKSITVTSWLLNADMIINCCKLKTHGMMGMSAAVKNMFGTIPGTMKPEYHFRFPDQREFANMLVDLQEYWKPRMLCHVVDGITGMEGNGPTAGTPRQVGVLMSGTDPYALDLIGGRIIGLEQSDVATMSVAFERGLGAGSADSVSLNRDDRQIFATRDNIGDLCIPDYELLETKADIQFGGNGIIADIRKKLFKTLFTSRPQVEKTECISCKKCFEICPTKAITMKDNIPEIDRSKCIKCFCCQEFCPKGAMKVKRTVIARILAH